METKLCINCKHFTDDMPQCRAAGNDQPDYVYGTKKEATLWSAMACRISVNRCGPEAKWFEPKESA